MYARIYLRVCTYIRDMCPVTSERRLQTCTRTCTHTKGNGQRVQMTHSNYAQGRERISAVVEGPSTRRKSVATLNSDSANPEVDVLNGFGAAPRCDVKGNVASRLQRLWPCLALISRWSYLISFASRKMFRRYTTPADFSYLLERI